VLTVRIIQANDPVASHVVQCIESIGLREACDLDLLLFFARHPRVVLSSEQLATYVGYELSQVARALEVLLGARILKRVRVSPPPARRMYVLDVERVDPWLEPLQRHCASPDGRRSLRTFLKERGGPHA
jgi:hypothetical protein